MVDKDEMTSSMLKIDPQQQQQQQQQEDSLSKTKSIFLKKPKKMGKLQKLGSIIINAKRNSTVKGIRKPNQIQVSFEESFVTKIRVLINSKNLKKIYEFIEENIYSSTNTDQFTKLMLPVYANRPDQNAVLCCRKNRKVRIVCNEIFQIFEKDEKFQEKKTKRYPLISNHIQTLLDFFSTLSLNLSKIISSQSSVISILTKIYNSETIKTHPIIRSKIGFLLAQVHIQYMNFDQAIDILQMIKFQCKKFKNWTLLKVVFLTLSEICSQLGKHKAANLFAQRCLELSWEYNSYKYEMLAMDMMGKSYFNMNMLQFAKYFHNRVKIKN